MVTILRCIYRKPLVLASAAAAQIEAAGYFQERRSVEEEFIQHALPCNMDS